MATPSQPPPPPPPVAPRHAALAVALGPLAHAIAGRPTRAKVAGALWALAVIGYGYAVYLQIYAALDLGGGETAQQVTDAAIKAVEAQILAAPQWLPGAIGVAFLANLACAADLAWLARKGGR